MRDTTVRTETTGLGHADRLAALARSGLLDSPVEPLYERVVDLVRQTVGAPVALVSLVDDTRQFFKALCGLEGWAADARGTPLSHSFCQHVVTDNAPLVIEDARNDPRVSDNGAVSDLGVIAYLGVPLHAPDGSVLGSLCSIDGEPRAWSRRDVSALQNIAAMVESDIALREAVEREQLLTREMNHRVKNVFAVVSGMVRMSAGYAADVHGYRDAVLGRLRAMAKAHALVQPDIDGEGIDETDVSLQALAATVLSPHMQGSDCVVLQGPGVMLSPRHASGLALILHEWATNAAKHGSLSVPDGQLDVRWDWVGAWSEERSDVIEQGEGATLRLTWSEGNGPTVPSPPGETGFGSRLIELIARGPAFSKVRTNWRRTGIFHQVDLLGLPVA